VKDDSDDKQYLLPSVHKHQSTDITTFCAECSHSSAATCLLKKVMMLIFFYISLDNFVTLNADTACDYDAMPCHAM
jgi:hypothetical protein